MAKSKSAVRLTNQSLKQLKDKGFQYVLVKGYAPDRRNSYIELNHVILVPVMELPVKPSEQEIFAPIDSEILMDWANSSDEGFEAFIDY